MGRLLQQTVVKPREGTTDLCTLQVPQNAGVPAECIHGVALPLPTLGSGVLGKGRARQDAEATLCLTCLSDFHQDFITLRKQKISY